MWMDEYCMAWGGGEFFVSPKYLMFGLFFVFSRVLIAKYYPFLILIAVPRLSPPSTGSLQPGAL
jgi:hypothetical protein